MHGALVREQLAWTCGLQTTQALGKNTIAVETQLPAQVCYNLTQVPLTMPGSSHRGLGLRVKDVTRGWTSHKKQKWSGHVGPPVLSVHCCRQSLTCGRAEHTTLSVAPSGVTCVQTRAEAQVPQNRCLCCSQHVSAAWKTRGRSRVIRPLSAL